MMRFLSLIFLLLTNFAHLHNTNFAERKDYIQLNWSTITSFNYVEENGLVCDRLPLCRESIFVYVW